jgi:hypothetical protein
MRNLSSVVVLAAVSACAAPRFYADPTADLDAYARITIRNAAASTLRTRLYEDPVTCAGFVAMDEKGGAVGSGETKAIYAKKGAPFTIGALYLHTISRGVSTCDMTTTVVPRSASYQVVFDTGAEGKTCRVGWAEGDGKSARPLPKSWFVSRSPTQPFLQSGAWCKELTDAERTALGVALPAAPK